MSYFFAVSTMVTGFETICICMLNEKSQIMHLEKYHELSKILVNILSSFLLTRNTCHQLVMNIRWRLHPKADGL